MTLENDCFGDFVEFSKKKSVEGADVRDEAIVVCTNRDYCSQQGECVEAYTPLIVQYWNGPITYRELPKCKLYSMDNKPKEEINAPAKVRKVKKIKVSAPEKSNEDPLLKKIKELVRSFEEKK